MSCRYSRGRLGALLSSAAVDVDVRSAALREDGDRARDGMRSVGRRRRVMEIARITRTKGQKQTKEKQQVSYKGLLNATGKVVGQDDRIADKVNKGVKKIKKLVNQLRLETLQAELESTRSVRVAWTG